jgi:DNA-binding NarL/FixJ family response regulator
MNATLHSSYTNKMMHGELMREIGIGSLREVGGADFAGKPAEPRIRIVLVEDHTILREGLKALVELEADFEIVGEFASMEESLEGIRALQPDLVVTDLELPGRSGVELLGEIQRLSPLTRKLVLTAHEGEEHIRSALHAGANGYILKDSNCAELMLAIRTVCLGQQFLCKGIAGKILSGYLSGHASEEQPRAVQPVGQSITEREREVLTRIALGNSNKSIARELGLSPKTVEKHRSNLMRKLQLHNAAAITMFAIRNGMTGTTPPPNVSAPLNKRVNTRLNSLREGVSVG